MSGIHIINYSDAWFLLLAGHLNSGKLVYYSDHNLHNRLKNSLAIQITIQLYVPILVKYLNEIMRNAPYLEQVGSHLPVQCALPRLGRLSAQY